MWAINKFHLVVSKHRCLLSASHECVNWCAWWGCVVVMNYCASICCVNSFPPMKSVWHNYTIHLQIFHIVSAHWLCITMVVALRMRNNRHLLCHHPPRPNWCKWLSKSAPVSWGHALASQPGCSTWSSGTGVKSVQWFQGLSRHQAPAL
jgi:hypothetical protein